MLLISIGAQAQPSHHAAGVADLIGLKRAIPAAEDGHGFASFSPDRTRFVLITQRGDAEEGVNVGELWIYSSQSVRAGHTGPLRRLIYKSSSNDDPIREVAWSEDGRSLTYIASAPGQAAQVLRLQIDSGEISPLTRSATSVVGYSLAGNTPDHILYVARSPWRSLWSAEQERQGLTITGQNFADLIEGRAGYFLRGLQEETDLLLDPGSGARPVALDRHLGRQFSKPSISPDGRYAVVVSQIPANDIPEAWRRCVNPYVRTMLRLAQRPGYVQSEFQQYELIDLQSGAHAKVLDAPAIGGGQWRPVWVDEGRSVLVVRSAGIFDCDSAELLTGGSIGPRMHPAAVEFEVATGSVRPVNPNCQVPLGWDPRRGLLRCARVAVAGGSPASEPVVHFKKTVNGWSEVRDRGNPPGLEVFTREDLDHPPRITIRATPGAPERVLLDLNPAIATVALGRVEQLEWTAPSGQKIRAGLYYPVNYVQGRRYPLVIQTHGWSAERFDPEGLPGSGFAAQPLSARGLFVLQVPDERLELLLSDAKQEVAAAIETYSSGIDLLVSRGFVDRTRVGVVGWSHTCFYVKYALAHTSLFRVAAIAEGEDGGYIQYLTGYNDVVDAQTLYGGPPYGAALSAWLSESPGFNLTHVAAPLRIAVLNPHFLPLDWEWFSGLSDLHKPVDMVMLRDGEHYLKRPYEKQIVSGGNIDWFDFWLNDHEDDDPRKAPQYERWSGMRGSSAGSAATTLRVVSSRPETVSDGTVLVELSAGLQSRLTVSLNGVDVTGRFLPTHRPRFKRALLGPLRVGENRLELQVDGSVRQVLPILNHSRTEPTLAGRRQLPFICETAANGMGSPIDSDCNAPTLVRYIYKSTAPEASAARSAEGWGIPPGFKSLPPAGQKPADLAQTSTTSGQSVAYVVRWERGTINRAVYEILFLQSPGAAEPSPWGPPGPGWNGRLVFLFGAGCGPGHHQGVLDESLWPLQEKLLQRGFAVATSSLNVFENGCNDRVSAETFSRVKELFIKQFGEPRHSIGWGSSGGAMQMYLLAQNYPGLLDGIVANSSFADVVTTVQSSTDCALLEHAFETSSLRWKEPQKAAVSGFATWRTCTNGWAGFSVLDPRRCSSVIAARSIYDATANPEGLRCDVFDGEVDQFGIDPKTSRAERPLDNVGVQYGLRAFDDGVIDADRFIDLNERIGGFDPDGHIVAIRSVARPEAVRVAYQNGLVFTGGGGSGDVPIIDWRAYSDDLADVHDRMRSLAIRSRLIEAQGNANNLATLVDTRTDIQWIGKAGAPFMQRTPKLIEDMDGWLAGISSDSSNQPRAAKILAHRPAALADGCWAPDGERLMEDLSSDPSSRCNRLYPAHGDPRIAAGAPASDHIVKCALKPIRSDDYQRGLSRDQLARLQRVFPLGVCDYERRGVGQQVSAAMWDGGLDHGSGAE